MTLLSLLNRPLKDDDVIELLEWMGTEVTYDFDRSHENMPDVYWAKADIYGLTLRFNEHQALDTIFLEVESIGEIRGEYPSLIEGITFFKSDAQVRAYAADHGIQIKSGSRPAALPPAGSWARLDYEHQRVHYEFIEGTLNRVTLSIVADTAS